MEHSLINVAVLWLSEENVQDIPTIKSLSMKKLLALEKIWLSFSRKCNLHLTDSSYDLKSSFVSCDDWVSRLSAARDFRGEGALWMSAIVAPSLRWRQGRESNSSHRVFPIDPTQLLSLILSINHSHVHSMCILAPTVFEAPWRAKQTWSLTPYSYSLVGILTLNR